MRRHQTVGLLRPLGFTLVEVVVVIGVLLLLLGLLTPLLASMKARSRETACITNLHQIGRAFQMYLDDYHARPPHLYQLRPQYVSDSRILLCPMDHWVRRGGWAWSAIGRGDTPPEKWPIPVSYGYFFTRDVSDPWWEQAQAAPGRPGYVVCVLHGQRMDGPSEDDEAPLFQGRLLRLCFDGGVLAKEIHYKKSFSTWTAMTDQEKAPGAPW